MKKYETLTKEQEARIPEYREKWLKIGLDTARANRPAAEQALKDAYKEGGLEPPKLMIWVDSPRGGLIAAKLVKEFLAKQPNGGFAAEKVWGQVWGQVVDQVGGQVVDQVRGQVRDQVGGQVRENFSSLQSEWDDLWFWGCHDAGWLSFYSYFKDVVGLECCARLDPLMRLAQETGWVWMYRGFAILTERHTELHRNDRHRLHNASGPAVKYADGYSVYAIDGMRVPGKIVETSAAELDAKEWLKQENVDHRRVAFQKIGASRVAKDLGAEVIDTMTCPIGGKYELLLLDIGLPEKMPYLKMNNPSLEGVSHIEGVEVGITTAAQAINWRNGIDSKQYSAPMALT